MITLGVGALIGGFFVYLTQKKHVKVEIKEQYKGQVQKFIGGGKK